MSSGMLYTSGGKKFSTANWRDTVSTANSAGHYVYRDVRHAQSTTLSATAFSGGFQLIQNVERLFHSETS